MTSDLHATCGHRPIYIRGEAATFIPQSSFLIRTKLSFRISGRHAPWANSDFKKSKKSLQRITPLCYNTINAGMARLF